MKINVNAPPPVVQPPITYDLVGLTEAQFDKIRLLLGEVRWGEKDTSEVYNEMKRIRPVNGYCISNCGPTRPVIHFGQSK